MSYTYAYSLSSFCLAETTRLMRSLRSPFCQTVFFHCAKEKCVLCEKKNVCEKNVLFSANSANLTQKINALTLHDFGNFLHVPNLQKKLCNKNSKFIDTSWNTLSLPPSLSFSFLLLSLSLSHTHTHKHIHILLLFSVSHSSSSVHMSSLSLFH